MVYEKQGSQDNAKVFSLKTGRMKLPFKENENSCRRSKLTGDIRSLHYKHYLERPVRYVNAEL